MAKGPPGGVIFDAIGLDRISEFRERDLGGTVSGHLAVRIRNERFQRVSEEQVI